MTFEHVCSVFRSRFRFLVESRADSDSGTDSANDEKHESPRRDGGTSPEQDEEGGNQGNVETCLDEDGDLDVTHRYEG